MLRLGSIFFITIFLNWIFSTDVMAQSAADYSSEPPVQVGALSPDGNAMALAVAGDGSQVVKVIELKDTAPISASNVSFNFNKSERQEVLWLGWASDEILLAQVRAIDSGFKGRMVAGSELVSISRDGKPIEKLGRLNTVSLRGNTDRFDGSGILSLLPQDPEHILIGVAGHGATKVNLKTGHAVMMRRGSNKLQYFKPDLRGEVRVAQGHKTDNETFYLKIRDTHGSEWREFDTYPGLTADEKILGFTSNPEELIVARYGENATMEFLVYDLAKKGITKTLFSDPDYDGAALVYNGQFDEVIGVEYVAEAPQTRFLESAKSQGMDKLLRMFPESLISILGNDALQEKFLVRINTATEPGVVKLVNTKTEKSKLIASDYADLDGLEHGSLEVVKYPARDGQNIPAYLTLPASVGTASNAKNLPFIVIPHGGHFRRKLEEFDWLTQYLSSRGYGVLQMNFRGTKGFGEAFLEDGRNDWSLMQKDVDDGAKWLISKGLADPEKLCILGWSFGGYLAQMAASDSDVGYVCAGSINGYSDWGAIKFDENNEFWGSKENRKFQIKNSPSSKVADVKMPIYIGQSELVLPKHFSQNKSYVSKLKKNKKDHVFVVFSGAEIQIQDPEDRLNLLETLTAFLETHLGKGK